MKHLVSISIGPVQGFIAAGRRPGDLFAGSQLLQDLARRAAEELENQAELIFPHTSKAAGSNKLLAVTESDPRELTENLRQHLHERLLGEWEDLLKRVTPGIDQLNLNLELAKEQLAYFLEFYAAWYPVSDDLSDYGDARQKVEALLASRKILRDFAPLDQHDAGVFKSSLDPSWAAILKHPEQPEKDQEVKVRPSNGEAPVPLRIKENEHLDAISLLKRIYGAATLGAVPTTRIFARRSIEPNTPLNAERDKNDPEKQPYFAVLVADGDKMGQLIANKKTPSEHRELSRQLAGFAKKAKDAISDYGGMAVYAGGDDLLAFLPVTGAVSCAREIYDIFHDEVGNNLSAGIAVAHYRQPLSITLDAARAAEREAKKERNSLAITLQTRSGSPTTVTGHWDTYTDWDAMLTAYKNRELPRGLAYELQKLALEWKGSPVLTQRALRKEVERILRQKGVASAWLSGQLDKIEEDTGFLAELSKRMLLTRFFTSIKEEQRAGSHN